MKTAVPRRIPLWPETVSAIKAWLPSRPKAKAVANSKLLFLTVRGTPWVTVLNLDTKKDAIGLEFKRLLVKLGLKRPSLGFYGLRHGFETIAGETTDQVAVDAVMGHVPSGMAAAYRERISDDRLRHVDEHVRQWVFLKGTTMPYDDLEAAAIAARYLASIRGLQEGDKDEEVITKLRRYVSRKWD